MERQPQGGSGGTRAASVAGLSEYRKALDAEFKRLIPALLPDEFKQLEANILQDGEIRNPLVIWRTGGQNILIDGHNRLKISEKHGLKYSTTEKKLVDRDHAKLWIAENQLGTRNLTDDQRSIIANDVREFRSIINQNEKMAKARDIKEKPILAKTTKIEPPKNARKEVAKESKLPERKIRLAQEIKKADPKLPEMVRAGEVTLVEAKKIASLPAEARPVAP